MDSYNHYFECICCKKEYSEIEAAGYSICCHDLVNVKFNYDMIRASFDPSLWLKRPPSVWSYRELLPIQNYRERITLMEGGTGLHRCRNLGRYLGLKEIYVKNEGENPSGSFKDRGMTVGVSRAVEIAKNKVACASTGNTSSSLAAYSAKAGIECLVLIPKGKIALGKMAQAIIHGATIIEIEGNFDDALLNVLNLTEKYEEIYLLNSVNPYRIEGQKTLAFEIWTQLQGNVPETIIIPVGNAGNIRAVWKGLTELFQLGLIKQFPRMIGIQAEGASPIADAFKKETDTVKPVKKPETVATAIRIGSPVNWRMALQAVRDSHGLMEVVTDENILEAQTLLAKVEGLFVEPASAASIAGLKKLIEQKIIEKDEVVTCIVTGHGLKDPKIVETQLQRPIQVSGNLTEIIQKLGLQKSHLEVI